MEKTIIPINTNYSYEIDIDLGLCIVNGSGYTDIHSTINAIEIVLNNSELIRNLDIVVDLKGLDFHPTFNEIMQLKSALLFLKGKFNRRIALIPPLYLFTLGQLVSTLTSKEKLNMKTFKSYESALSWLKLVS